jgi:hypothetical protein
MPLKQVYVIGFIVVKLKVLFGGLKRLFSSPPD